MEISLTLFLPFFCKQLKITVFSCDQVPNRKIVCARFGSRVRSNSLPYNYYTSEGVKLMLSKCCATVVVWFEYIAFISL